MLFLISLIFFALLYASQTQAIICPVCTIGIGIGLGLSRYLGVSDLISGLWAGGLIMSLIFWTINWLDKRKIKFLGRKILIIFLYYFLTFYPLFQLKIIGHPDNKIWQIDKLIVGIIIGSVVLIFSFLLDKFLRLKNNNQKLFTGQKVIISISLLIITSLILYFGIKV